MHQSAKKLDSVEVTRKTDQALHLAEVFISGALNFQNDPDKIKRLEKRECKSCFYLRKERIGGAACTTRPCATCSQEMYYGSTNTDVLCLACAKKHELCKHCGADIKLRPRRIFKIEQNP